MGSGLDDGQIIRWLGYGLAWASFGFFHSMLAGHAAKARAAPQIGAHYRLGYNVFATLHLLIIFGIGTWLFWDAGEVVKNQGYRHIMQVASVFGFGLLVYAALGYDLGRFSGFTQIKNEKEGKTEPEDEPLRTDGLHAYVRHPIYAGLVLMLWGRAYSEFGLATALFASLYLAIGMAYEERKLVKLYGEAYRTYAEQVPALIPWKGRAWDD